MARLVILGGGESGVGTAILGFKKKYDVFVSDKGKIKRKYKDVLEHFGINWEEENHSEEKILNADVVMKSPGIPDTVPLVIKLKEKNIPVISEIEFVSKYTDAKIIGITGSNGKTTTTMLTHHILKEEGLSDEEKRRAYIQACEQLEDLLLAEAGKMKTELVSARELQRIKKLNQRDFIDRMRSNESLAGTLATLEVQVGWRYRIYLLAA